MIVTTLNRQVDPVLAAQNTARGLALMVADAVDALFETGRWPPQWPLAAEIRSLAAMIGVLHAEIGDISERSFAERLVETMANSAHQLIVQARLARAAGAALPCPVGEAVLFDVQAEGILIGTYSLLAI